MAIDRSFTVSGHGTVVTGTIASGMVALGDDLEWFPSGRVVRVRGLQQHDQPADRLGRGARAAINLGGVHHSEIQRGHELASPGYLAASRIMSVQLRVSADSSRSLRHRSRYRIHLGTAETSTTVALMDGSEIAPGDSAFAQLFLAEPLVAVHGQPFVLRAESPPSTIGGGIVLQPLARRYRRRDVAAVDRLTRLSGQDAVARVTAVLASTGLSPWTEPGLSRDSGLPTEALPSVLQELIKTGALVELPMGPRRTIRVLSEFASELDDRVIRALRRLHAARPRQSAIPRSHLMAELPDLSNDTLISGVIERLKACGAVTCDSRTVSLTGYKPKLSQAERQLKQDLADALCRGGFGPPDVTELMSAAGQRGAVVPELLALLVAEETAIEIGSGLFLAVEHEMELRRRASERLANSSGLTMAELRDLLGTTRKYAVPIGEYLDRIGLTYRDGDVRRLATAEPAST
jgi:selenocysteine-specific elongation factor